MVRTLTPRKIFTSFKKSYPKLSKHVVHWHPKNALELIVYLNDGSKLLYTYDEGRAVMLGERWKD